MILSTFGVPCEMQGTHFRSEAKSCCMQSGSDESNWVNT